MPSGKSNRITPERASDKRETVFTGEEIGFPMVGEATATEGFDAIPLTWHSHSRIEVLMLLRGGAAYEFKNGSVLEFSGGQMLVVPADMLHRGSRDVRMPSVICAVNFALSPPAMRHGPFLKQEMAWIAAQYQDRTPRVHSMSPTVRRMANDLHRMIVQQRKSSRTAVGIASMRLLVASLIVEVTRQTSETHRRSTPDAVARAKEYMEDRFATPLQMDEVAQQAGCSRAHLFVVFKRETGMSPNDWIQRYRVQAATELLRSTDRKLEDIAAAVGFSSAQYFCQVFRKYTGQTPAWHRQKS
jgi:AraC-like DNA-binding protein/mannose-6-phosphate isomerase-like protein (cupin superfamily)